MKGYAQTHVRACESPLPQASHDCEYYNVSTHYPDARMKYVLGLSSKKKSNNHAIIYIACFTVKCNLLLLYHCFYIHPKLEMSAQTIRFKSLYSPLEVVNV